MPTCPLCQNYIFNLDFHHWEYYGDEQGVKICRNCHNRVHGGLGRRVRDQGYAADRLNDISDPGDWGEFFEDWRDMALLHFFGELLIQIRDRSPGHYETLLHLPSSGSDNRETDMSDRMGILAKFTHDVCAMFNIPGYLRKRAARMLYFNLKILRIVEYGDEPDLDLQDWALLADIGWLSTPPKK